MTTPVRVELLTIADCPGKPGAEAMITEIAKELGVNVSLELHEVADERQGEQLRFAGSPTIRVEGVDIEPGWESSGDFTLRCRVYQTATGLRGLPEPGWLRSAYEAAAAQTVAGEGDEQ
jgi:hypothetical protein